MTVASQRPCERGHQPASQGTPGRGPERGSRPGHPGGRGPPDHRVARGVQRHVLKPLERGKDKVKPIRQGSSGARHRVAIRVVRTFLPHPPEAAGSPAIAPPARVVPRWSAAVLLAPGIPLGLLDPLANRGRVKSSHERAGCSSPSYTPVHRSQCWALDLRGDGLRTLANRLGPIS